MHTNWLELSAVLFGVKCFVHLRNCLIKVFCDNSTAVAYINNLGGMVPSLHAVSKSIWAGADPGFSERGGCTDVGDLEGAVRPLPTRGVWRHAPPEKFEI